MRVVAEYGMTCGGSVEEAHRQVDAAADAGCWAYKTQLLHPETIAAEDAPLYWSNTLGKRTQQQAFRDAGIVPYDAWPDVVAHCSERGLKFCASPFDLAAVELLGQWGAVIKIASGDITFEPLVALAGQQDCPVILSTGASTASEVLRALRWVNEGGPPEVTVLACSLVYPCPITEARLGRITALRDLLKPAGALHVGYSDHTSSPSVALAAAVSGADTIEVHCTLRPEGEDVADHAMALDPDRLASYVADAKLGEGVRGGDTSEHALTPTDAEAPARVGARRALYASTDLAAGELVEHDQVLSLRPADPLGFEPWEWRKVVGHRLKVPVEAGRLIRRDLFR